MQLGQYEIKEEIGQGPRSVVYRAYQRNLKRPVALKMLRRYDEASKRKFHQEATITANLSHEGIRRVLGAEEMRYEGRPLWCVVMEYVDHSLRSMIGRPMDVKKAAGIAAQIADVLHYVHLQGLVHLDVKPSNILIFKDGRAVLSDFGIAHHIGERTTDGTPAYMSPEQARGEPVRPASDVYSLGAVLYEMMTGRPPYRAENDLALIRKHADPAVEPVPPRRLNPQLPQEAERIILKALEKDPRQRYTTAAEMAEDLRELAFRHPSTNITTMFAQVPKPAWFAIVLIPILILVWRTLFNGPLSPLFREVSPTPTFTVIVPTGTKNFTEVATRTPPTPIPREMETRGTETPAPTLRKPTETLKPLPTVSVTPTSSPTPETISMCPNPEVRITSPAPGAQISGDVAIVGAAQFDPDRIRYYKVQWQGPDSSEWITMGRTHKQPVEDGQLEFWRAGGLPPGKYRLRLVLVGHDAREKDACIIPVTVVSR